MTDELPQVQPPTHTEHTHNTQADAIELVSSVLTEDSKPENILQTPFEQEHKTETATSENGELVAEQQVEPTDAKPESLIPENTPESLQYIKTLLEAGQTPTAQQGEMKGEMTRALTQLDEVLTAQNVVQTEQPKNQPTTAPTITQPSSYYYPLPQVYSPGWPVYSLGVPAYNLCTNGYNSINAHSIPAYQYVPYAWPCTFYPVNPRIF